MTNKIATILFIALLVLSSCKTNKSKTGQLRNHLDQVLKKEYSLNHGQIIVKYDLANINQSSCLIAKNYGRISNDKAYNKLFLQKFKNRNKSLKSLNINANKKTTKLINLILRLNGRYQYLSKKDLGFIKSLKEYSFFGAIKNLAKAEVKSKNGLEDIANLDHIVSNIPFFLPQNNLRITSHYGMRKHPIKKRKKLHCGIDLVGQKSTPIYSAASGKVSKIGRQGNYGNIVEITHERDLKTKYAHLKLINVNMGENVLDGQKIGLQGNTGKTTAEHLHFEILFKNKPIDPYDFIAHGFNC